MKFVSKDAPVTESTLPIAMALYIVRPDIKVYPWDECGTWRFINGSGTNHPQQVAGHWALFSDAVAAFLLGEIGDYYGDWVSRTLEQVTNCNNGSIVKVDAAIIKTRSVCVISRDELDMLVAGGLKPVNYIPDIA
ncbi:MAG: hypothetical protein WC919_05145 [Candidatus Paceibacterota bacterium]|jgi:hypothetical protein